MRVQKTSLECRHMFSIPFLLETSIFICTMLSQGKQFSLALLIRVRPNILARRPASLLSSLKFLEALTLCSWCVRFWFFLRTLARVLLSLSTSLWFCSL